jgi:fringe protein
MPRLTNRYAFRRRFILIFLLLISFFLLFITLINEEKYFYSSLSSTSTISDRIIILIRTSYHCQSRLNYLLQSWLSLNLIEQSNIYLLTDNISKYSNKTILNSFQNLIETNCSQTHSTVDLCCKTAHEFELFYNLTEINSNLDWMCRFDDDQYVNLKNLYNFLSQIDSSKLHYIGRTSIDHRLKIAKQNRTFTFATYGAGVCFSRGLLEKLRPYVNKNVLPYGCVQRKISDDAYIGYLSEFILNVSLTSNRELFHSHLEKLDISFRRFNIDQLRYAITFGFAWDRYQLDWLPIIHQLIQLVNKGEGNTANQLWLFLQNYEKQHPENLTDKYDQSCTSYKKRQHQSNVPQKKKS